MKIKCTLAIVVLLKTKGYYYSKQCSGYKEVLQEGMANLAWWSVVQECLHSKHEALSSNPSTSKKKKLPA
jgi:hypothetical protein